MNCKECANLIQTVHGPRCRYEINPVGQVCLKGERFKPKEARE